MHAPTDQAGEHQFSTISEAARLLQVSQATVRRWVQAEPAHAGLIRTKGTLT